MDFLDYFVPVTQFIVSHSTILKRDIKRSRKHDHLYILMLFQTCKVSFISEVLYTIQIVFDIYWGFGGKRFCKYVFALYRQ